jgi:hypothetical protein
MIGDTYEATIKVQFAALNADLAATVARGIVASLGKGPLLTAVAQVGPVQRAHDEVAQAQPV